MIHTEHRFTVGGDVQAGGGLYIERVADDELLAYCRAGDFAYVLTARQMGKSSLKNRTAERLEAEGIRTVRIDLTRIGTQVSAEQWFLGLLVEISDQLDLTTDPLAWWAAQHHLGLTQRFSMFLESVVLVERQEPIIIFIDEIDTTLSLDFTDDFYAAVRAVYTERARLPDLARLTFVLIGVALPGDLIKDPHRTPFNIGVQIALSDFSAAETDRLVENLGLAPESASVVRERMQYWTGGQPYLTQRLCAAIAERPQADWDTAAIDRLVAELFAGERSRQDNHLQFVRDMLTRRAPNVQAVLGAYRRVLRGQRVLDVEGSLAQDHLKLSGVVRVVDGVLVVRNQLYATIFDQRWVAEHMPRVGWSKRARRLAIGALAGSLALSLLLGVFLAGSNSQVGKLEEQRTEAEQQRAAAETARVQAEEQRTRTEQALRQARSGELAAQAIAIRDEFPQHSRLLAVEAVLITQRMGEPITPAAAQALLDTTQNRAGQPLRGHESRVNALALSGDGTRLVTGSEDGTARVWDLSAADPNASVVTLRSHESRVTALALSGDGTRLVTGSYDNTARVWDLSAADPNASVVTLRGHDGPVYTLALSGDGTRLVTGSNDNTARVWNLSITEVVALACRGAARNLTQAEWQRYYGASPYQRSCPDLPAEP